MSPFDKMVIVSKIYGQPSQLNVWYRVDFFGYSVEQSKMAEQGGSKS